MEVKEFIGEKAKYIPEGQMIFGGKKGDEQILLDVRGWGAIQYLFKDQKEAGKFQDEFGQWVADAINEKLSGELEQANRTIEIRENTIVEQSMQILNFSLRLSEINGHKKDCDPEGWGQCTCGLPDSPELLNSNTPTTTEQGESSPVKSRWKDKHTTTEATTEE